MLFMYFFFFKQKTEYDLRISDWSSDVCSSDLSQLCVRYLAPADVDEGHGDLLAGLHERPIRIPSRYSYDDRGSELYEARIRQPEDQKCVVEGKSVSGRVDLGGRRIIKKKTNIMYNFNILRSNKKSSTIK